MREHLHTTRLPVRSRRDLVLGARRGPTLLSLERSVGSRPPLRPLGSSGRDAHGALVAFGATRPRCVHRTLLQAPKRGARSASRLLPYTATSRGRPLATVRRPKPIAPARRNVGASPPRALARLRTRGPMDGTSALGSDRPPRPDRLGTASHLPRRGESDHGPGARGGGRSSIRDGSDGLLLSRNGACSWRHWPPRMGPD